MNKALLKELLQLTASERMELAHELWESIPAEQQAPLTPAQMEEIDRRIEEHERNPSRAIPWEEVREWLWSRRK